MDCVGANIVQNPREQGGESCDFARPEEGERVRLDRGWPVVVVGV